VLVIAADLHGGAMVGKGTSGDDAVRDQAFFARIPNATYGFAATGRFLFFGANLKHHQYVGPRISKGSSAEKPALATWTQLTVGIDFAIDLGSEEQKKAKRGPFVQIAAGAGFGVGTGQQVDPPLDNKQIDDKAFLLEGRIGFGKHVAKHWDIGVLVPVGYGYFLKNGVPANDLDNHYQGLYVEALAFLRLRIKVL
jgi:hypothetical protein